MGIIMEENPTKTKKNKVEIDQTDPPYYQAL